MAYSDRELLARLIQCEAGGEGEDGMKAVAGVVTGSTPRAGSMPGSGRAASAISSFSPISSSAPARRRAAPTTPRISTT